MQAVDVTVILAYYGDIPALLEQTEKELEELYGEYNCLHGIAMDGMPHGSTPGNVTARLAEKLGDDARRTQRLVQLHARRADLEYDSAIIRVQINTLGIVAQNLVCEHYVKGRKWEDVRTPQNWSVATKKRKAAVILWSLAQKFEALPDKEKLLARARDARAI